MGDDFLGDFDRLKEPGSNDDKRPQAKPFRKNPVAIGGAVVVVLLALVSLLDGDDSGPPTAATDSAPAAETASSVMNTPDQFSWSVQIGDSTVILKGDKPNGYPSETWADGELLDRDEGGDFAWDTQTGVPSPVAIIQSLNTCAQIKVEFDLWIEGSDSAPSEDSAIRQLAYAQAALNRAAALSCP